jgi:hypothetical protein
MYYTPPVQELPDGFVSFTTALKEAADEGH